ncbi:MAG: YggS family pyridoxal phosphate-dependent enzyme [Candidatus Omnitrophota bacterium]|nr:MAG: YggS family pyridoxal phosphate-dependent enzyme [Candidatus Omnitrophota bacterium]RKY43651.1 MAG: YggS family pyridoxal phosphate-dependent enzyme [Candidatus Omnitrophota bacterium]
MIKERITKILEELPPSVTLEVATKSRTISEIKEAISAGVKVIGENYVQEAEEKIKVIGKKVSWHLIGYLQKNKAKKAVKLFDMIESLHSLELARLLNRECEKIGKVMPVLIEVNIAREPQKSGVYPEEVENLVKDIGELKNIKLQGLMTMGPFLENPEELRPYFKKMREIFISLKSKFKNAEWKYLSMGMSSSYKIAIEEGANLIRIGTLIFGKR